MKKKTVITHIIVIIVCIFVGGKLASSLLREQEGVCLSKPMESNNNLFGMNRLMADVNWMFFINYVGSINEVNEETGAKIYEKIDDIIRSNPDFEQAYELGSLMLSVQYPEKAIHILQRGCDNPRLNNNWKIPYYAGFIASQQMKDYPRAEKFFQQAFERSSPPELQVVSSLLRAKANITLSKKTWNDIPITTQNQSYLCTLMDIHTYDMKSGYGDRHPEEGLVSSGITSVGNMTLNEKMLSVAQCLKREEGKEEGTLLIIDKMKKLMFADAKVCDNCMSNYGPGDKFCSCCGEKVVPYGLCGKCGALKKGNFCSECGAK